MSCENELNEIDYTGVQQRIKLRRGDSFRNITTCTLYSGVTITTPLFQVFDSNGDVVITGTTSIDGTGTIITWGLENETETGDLSEDGDYTYRLGATLSNGLVQTIYHGDLEVL